MRRIDWEDWAKARPADTVAALPTKTINSRRFTRGIRSPLEAGRNDGRREIAPTYKLLGLMTRATQCLFRVKSRHSRRFAQCPLFPRKWTSAEMFVKGHKQNIAQSV